MDRSEKIGLGVALAGHVLLFGNSYDHKGIAPTLRLLAEAFPMQDFAVLGGQVSGQGPAVPGVHVIPSGEMAEDEVHRLVATARAVVYPSFYEGFGLPVVESLAYGRPVLVRQSPLWAEVAAHSRLPGRLIAPVTSRSRPAGLTPTLRACSMTLPRWQRIAASRR